MNVNAVRLTEPKQNPLVADDIINDEVDAIVDFHPEPESVNVPELKEKIYNKRKPKYKGK